jgi:hypothetical protein
LAAPDIASPQPGSADGGEQIWRLVRLRQAGEAVRAGDADGLEPGLEASAAVPPDAAAEPPALERTGGG